MNPAISTDSTDHDLAVILGWLRQEFEQQGASFYCNHDLIKKAHKAGTLLVLREGQEAVAFQFGRLLMPGILAVRPDRRGLGYGTMIVQHCIREAQAKDICFLHIQCTPDTSIPFWTKMGFTLFPHATAASAAHGYAHPNAFMILPKTYEMPAGEREVSVRIQFYDDGAEHSPNAQPLSEYRPRAYRRGDGGICLASRVVGLHPQGSTDMAIKITVEGEAIYFGRAKYAEKYGVLIRQPVFILDRIIDRH